MTLSDQERERRRRQDERTLLGLLTLLLSGTERDDPAWQVAGNWGPTVVWDEQEISNALHDRSVAAIRFAYSLCLLARRHGIDVDELLQQYGQDLAECIDAQPC